MLQMAAQVAVISACWVLLSCGGEDEEAGADEAVAAVRSYLAAIYEGDPTSACSALSDDAQADLVDLATLDIPEAPPVDDCADAIELANSIGGLDIAAAGVMDYELVTVDAADLPVEVVASDGSSAELRVGESQKTVNVSESPDAAWTIDALDFTDTPR